jgi:acyl-CoA-dependent ceramide synthase
VLPALEDQAMSDRSADVELWDEKADAANGRLPEKGDGVHSMDQKLNPGGAQQLPARPMPLKKKAKRREDGPLEIVCKWIVEYQVGTSLASHLHPWTMTDDQP